MFQDRLSAPCSHSRAQVQRDLSRSSAGSAADASSAIGISAGPAVLDIPRGSCEADLHFSIASFLRRRTRLSSPGSAAIDVARCSCESDLRFFIASFLRRRAGASSVGFAATCVAILACKADLRSEDGAAEDCKAESHFFLGGVARGSGKANSRFSLASFLRRHNVCLDGW